MAETPIVATYVNATTLTATVDADGIKDLRDQCAIGVKIKADCGADGYKYGVVSAVSYSDPTTTVQITGDDLTSNLVSFWHSNDNPAALVNHGHTGTADGGDLPDYVKANCSVPFTGGHIPAEGDDYTGFKFTENNAGTDAKKSFYQVGNSQIALILTNDAETVFNSAWTLDRDGATPTYLTINAPVICDGGLETDTFNGVDVSNGVASLNASALVVQNPANATATPTANKIPIADGSGKLDSWVTAAGIGALASGTDINIGDYKVQRPYLQDWAEVVNARGSISGAQTIDLELGNVVTATITATTTFTFSNPPATGRAGGFVLVLTNGGAGVITWPSSVKWAGGTAPTLTASGVDVLTFITLDAGTTYRGILSSKDSK